MPQQRFSDTDIQAYLENNFEGDIPALEDYLHNTEEGQQQLAFYRSLYMALDKEPAQSLSFSLSNAVLRKIETSRKSLQVGSLIIWVLTAMGALALLYYCYRILIRFSFFNQLTSDNVIAGALLLLVLVVVCFNGIDLWIQKKRYRLLS